MRALIFILSVVLCVAGGCKNEPFPEYPLAIRTLINHGPDPDVTSTYNYRDQQIYLFTVGTSVTKFYYNGDQVNRTVSDSTATSYKVTRFFPTVRLASLDSTYLYTVSEAGAVSVQRIGTRTIQYDGAGKPVSVHEKKWTTEGVNTDHTAELTWDEAGNVNYFVYTNHLAFARTSTVISYDDQSGIYTQGPDYEYTVAVPELYRLSVNNPVAFNDGTTEKVHKYWYNKFGYPSNYLSDANVVYGMSYTQMRE